MAIRDGHVSSKINNVILAWLDLGVDVFDPRTWSNYDDQARRLGQSMNDTVGSVGDSVGAGLSETAR